MVKIKYGGPHSHYSADQVDGVLEVTAKPGLLEHNTRFSVFAEEARALRWLCDRGLRKSKAKQLLDAELRGTGPFAHPDHPRRLDRAGK